MWKEKQKKEKEKRKKKKLKKKKTRSHGCRRGRIDEFYLCSRNREILLAD